MSMVNTGSPKYFIFSEASDNADGSMTIKGLAALAFSDGSNKSISGFSRSINNDDKIPNDSKVKIIKNLLL